MPKKSKKQITEEFLEKIKTITVGTGAKPDSDPTCFNCGEPLSKHKLVAELVGVAVPIPRRERKPEPKHSEEVAFAA